MSTLIELFSVYYISLASHTLSHAEGVACETSTIYAYKNTAVVTPSLPPSLPPSLLPWEGLMAREEELQ